MTFQLTVVERAELIRRSCNRRAALAAMRARVILLVERGHTWNAVIDSVGCSRGFIAKWVGRFREIRIAGLDTHHRGGCASVVTRGIEARVLRAAEIRTAAGGPRWSSRSLGRKLGLSHMTVHRIWQKHGVTPAQTSMKGADHEAKG